MHEKYYYSINSLNGLIFLGNSRKTIVDVIQKALGEFADQEPIAIFLQGINE